MRALSQSLAKEFMPRGIHVSHAIIDGVIDIPRTKDWVVGDGKEDAKISSEGVSPDSNEPDEWVECMLILESTDRGGVLEPSYPA